MTIGLGVAMFVTVATIGVGVAAVVNAIHVNRAQHAERGHHVDGSGRRAA
jgi:hypothetical protein